MNQLAQAHEILMTIWNDVLTPEVLADASWHNGTGYLDGAVLADVSTTSKFKLKDGRRGLLIPVAPKNNIVIFERYSPGHGPAVLVANTCNELRTIIFSACQLNELQLILKIIKKEKILKSEVVALMDERYGKPQGEDGEWVYNHQTEILMNGLTSLGLM